MYQLTDSSTIHRLCDNTAIPNDLENIDYQAYLKWLEEGNFPLPAAGQEGASEEG